MKYKFSLIFCDHPFLICLTDNYDLAEDLIPCKCKNIHTVTYSAVWKFLTFQSSLASLLHVVTDTLLSHFNLSLSTLMNKTAGHKDCGLNSSFPPSKTFNHSCHSKHIFSIPPPFAKRNSPPPYPSSACVMLMASNST